MKRPLDLARASFDAYIAKDRAAIEAILADDFHFTSPYDNRIDRAAYFEICWANSKSIKTFEILATAETDDKAFVTYVGENIDGHRFRNTEVYSVKDGKIVEVEVYFGWTVPHPVPAGQHRIDEK